MAETSEQKEPVSGPSLDTRVVKVGKLRFAIGTMWLSWATLDANPTEARAWLAAQEDVLPEFEALFIAPGAENRTDIGLSSVFQPKLRALSQVISSHADTFAPHLPEGAYRWGITAETGEGIYLCAASRDGLPLADALVETEEVEAIKAGLNRRFTDIQWVEQMKAEDFEQKVLAHSANQPIALPKASKMKARVVTGAAIALALIGAFVFVQRYRAEKAYQAQLAALAAVKPTQAPPSGYQLASALRACRAVFQHTNAMAPGWHLISATCDVHSAAFIWMRGAHGLATTAPVGARVAADLRTAMLTIPLRIQRCRVDSKVRSVRVAAAISDWAIQEHEAWRAGGGLNALFSIEGIIPAWEMPVGTCAKTLDVRWSRHGVWRLDLGW